MLRGTGVVWGINKKMDLRDPSPLEIGGQCGHGLARLSGHWFLAAKAANLGG